MTDDKSFPIGSACSKGGGHIEFDFEGGGCGSGVYANIVVSIEPLDTHGYEGPSRAMLSLGDRALTEAVHEINTALQFWMEAGSPGR